MKQNKEKFLRRVIILSWIALAICCIIKLFGGSLFEILCSNENFITVCDYTDSHLWLNPIISAMYSFISLYFFVLGILQRTKFKKWELIVLLFTVLSGIAIKIWIISLSNYAELIYNLWQYILMPILFIIVDKRIKKCFNIIIANIFIIAFQTISLHIKNIDFGILGESPLIGIIYSIDIIIMEILFFAYMNLKAENNILKNKNEVVENE